MIDQRVDGLGLRSAGHSKGRRLALIAEPLEPERAPYWVAEPRGGTPSQGWWWMPLGERYPQFLGHNAAVAEIALVQLISTDYPPAA